jgi:hypothetical protein
MSEKSQAIIDLPSLEKTNPHPRDSDIEFFDEGHIYDVKGDRTYTSSTTFIHGFFGEFDADKVIQNMRRSARGMKPEYQGLTDDEIKAMWEANRDNAARLGTKMHECIEYHYNGWPPPLEAGEALPDEFTRLFAAYEARVKRADRQWTPYRTEWCVYDDEHKLTGSVDMLYQADPNDDSKLVIVDWKRSKGLKYTSFNETGKGPLCMLPDCNFWHYSLQLNLYRWMLQKHYGKTIVGMYLVVLHPNQKEYIEKEVPLAELEIEEMLQLRKAELATTA